MATVVCNKNCQYRKAVFCGKDFVMLNPLGQCSEWFAKNGQPKIIFNFKDSLFIYYPLTNSELL